MVGDKIYKDPSPAISVKFLGLLWSWAFGDILSKKGQIIATCTSYHKQGSSSPGRWFHFLEAAYSIARITAPNHMPGGIKGFQL